MLAMRSAMNLSLPAELKKWVDKQVKAGGYGTASEYMRDMLRRARDREAKRELDAMLLEAVREGATIEMDEADFERIRKTARDSVARSKKKKAV